MNTEQVIDRAIEVILDSHLSPEEATTKVLTDADLDVETVENLIWVGLNRLVNGELVRVRRSTDRRGENEGTGGTRSGRYQLPTRPTEGAKAVYHLWKPYQAADGSQKPLYDFTAEDWQHNANRTTERINGLQRHLDLFQLGCELVDGSKAKTADDLSIRARNRLEEAAARAFSAVDE